MEYLIVLPLLWNKGNTMSNSETLLLSIYYIMFNIKSEFVLSMESRYFR